MSAYDDYINKLKSCILSGGGGGGNCSTTVSETGATGATGPTGSVVYDGTGYTGDTGATGATGAFQYVVYNSIYPTSDASINIGSSSSPFAAGYFSAGTFGLIETDGGTTIYPVTTYDASINLGSSDRKFGEIYCEKLYVDPGTIVVTDGDYLMNMSFSTSTGGVNYGYNDASGNSYTKKSITTSTGNANQIDSKYLPFTTFNYLDLFDPSNETISDKLTTLFSTIPSSSSESTGDTTSDPVAKYTSGYYLITDTIHITLWRTIHIYMSTRRIP